MNTWAYDKAGRAILAIQGPPSSSTGKVSIDYRRQPGQGRNGLTLVTDAHGNPSRFVTAMRGGRYVLLDAGGTGCPGCPAPGRRARHADQGRLTQINQTRMTRAGGRPITNI